MVENGLSCDNLESLNQTCLFFPLCRPPNPIEYLASYLLKNKDQFEQLQENPGTQPPGAL